MEHASVVSSGGQRAGDAAPDLRRQGHQLAVKAVAGQRDRQRTVEHVNVQPNQHSPTQMCLANSNV